MAPAARLVLASSSPRRQELLRQAGYRFTVTPPGPIENGAVGRAASAAAMVESLAYLKAAAAVEAHGIARGPVLGCDTTVEAGGRILGKSRDAADARRILRFLAGTTHRVLTGLALLAPETGRRWLAHDATVVRFGPMSDEEIADYVAGGEALGKAGAYALQETGDRFVEGLEGSTSNVVGLPLELLERMLKAAGFDPNEFRDVD